MRWFFGLALLAAGAFASWHFFHSPRYSYRLAVCAILKNEGPWLKEWIAYHHDVLGVDHFYLYDNDGTDKSLSILRPYIDRGIVEWIDWNSQDETHHTSGAFMDAPWSACQLGAYNDCLKKRAFGKAQWVAMIDADEFIVPVHGIKSFYDLLKKAEKTNRGSVRIFWRVFGTSGVLALAEGELLTEKLIHRSEDAFAWNQLVKSIHRPEAVAFCLVHEAERLNPPYRSKTWEPDAVRIHHYWTRTEQDCLSKRGLNESLSKSLNSKEDKAILQYLPTLKNSYAELVSTGQKSSRETRN